MLYFLFIYCFSIQNLFRNWIYLKSKVYLHVSEKQYTVFQKCIILWGTEQLKLQSIILEWIGLLLG